MPDTLPKRILHFAEKHPEAVIQYTKDKTGIFQPTTFPVFVREFKAFAAGLHNLGVKKGDHVGLISENRKEWLISDIGILALGAADVPRGCDSTAEEISYILSFSECRVIIIENEAQLAKINAHKKELGHLKHIILIDAGVNPEGWLGVKLHSFAEVLENGKELYDKHPEQVDTSIQEGDRDDIATLIFTSGTTGVPKGVMLTHGNFLHQVENVPKLINTGLGDIWLCVLPVWHSFERIMQYVATGWGSALAYSKPVGKIMLADMQQIKPTWMASVPRIWEAVQAGIYRNINKEGGVKKILFYFFVAAAGAWTGFRNRLYGLLPEFKKRIRVLDILIAVLPFLLLYPVKALGDLLVFSKITAKLGGNFVAGISGGGALPKSVDRFFSAAGILLLEGYGLTETAPVLGVRDQKHPVPGTIGPVFPGTVIEIRDEEGNILPPGHKGIVFARGPQVMKGYFKQPELTRAILSPDGWLNTGDLGMLTWHNELAIMGRVKDTIVLRGGENVEPLPIEQKMQESSYISQSMLLGQDQKFLAALIVPDFEALQDYASQNNLSFMDREDLLGSPEIEELINGEIQERINGKSGFKSFERVNRFRLLTKPFEVGDELSQKQEIKRHVINEKYEKLIQEIFS
ncbi:AMP-binding protein [Marispirochaeta aestuarii]|uniref:AMP-dependent synthetase/ligase n=1 Tax=Marispirochaeta aestuarii TaxID=1963862 RepID=UPI0029C8AD57|nr:AMP-binding protein [Marispirochaeta aestuarii]